jgi:hypothetical protein
MVTDMDRTVSHPTQTSRRCAVAAMRHVSGIVIAHAMAMLLAMFHFTLEAHMVAEVHDSAAHVLGRAHEYPSNEQAAMPVVAEVSIETPRTWSILASRSRAP